jgi:hypothetical protein
LCPP